MASRRKRAQLFAELEERYGERVAQAFFEAVDSLRSLAEVQRVTAAIEAGNFEQALEALHIDAEAFNGVAESLREAFQEGGKAEASFLPRRDAQGSALVVRFDGRNPSAESWLNAYSSDLIRRMTDDQKQAVRRALAGAMERGIGPRAAALEVVGRVSRATGKRTGGILGLSAMQADQVERAKLELTTGTPNTLNHYLTRKARDRRFDRSIQKAIRTGEPIPAKTIANAVTAYEQRLLKLRGETIARTESMSALAKGAYETYRQAIESGKVDAAAVTKVWRTASDLRVRDSHRAMNGQSVGFYESFTTPAGARMLHPMDRSGGASAADVINCRCVCEYDIDFYRNIR